MFDVPELAIATFERLHGVRVTVHDLAGTLWGALTEDRFRHTHPLCLAVKARDDGAYCFELECTKLRRELPSLPQGRIHRCHAGLVEWVVPVFAGSTLEWVIFAGPRTCDSSPTVVAQMGRPQGVEKPWSDVAKLPESVTAQQANDILEHLRQLASRLSLWAKEVYGDSGAGHPAPAGDEASLRATLIMRFIANHHREPITLAGLASQLGLSPSRASHVVREVCGRSFQEIVIESRTKTAMGLLRTSPMPIAQISAYSGFSDVAHFHRVIKRAAGMSPGQYRRSSGT